MDRGRATCGGQKPTAPTTRLIRGYSLRINTYYATRPALHEEEDRDARRGPSRRLEPWGWPRVELKVPIDGGYSVLAKGIVSRRPIREPPEM